MKKSEIAFGVLRIPVDFGMVVLGFMLGYKIRKHGDFIPGMQFPLDPTTFPPVADYFHLVLYFAALLVAVFFFFGLYSMKNTDGPLQEQKKVVIFSTVWILLVTAYFFALRQVFFSRLVLGMSFIITLALLITARLILHLAERQLLKSDIGTIKLLVIGANRITEKIVDNLTEDPHYKIVGYISLKNVAVSGLKRLGSLNELARMVRKFSVDRIIQTGHDLDKDQEREILDFCKANHIEYSFVPDILEMERSNVEIVPVAGLPLIHLKPTPLEGWGKIVKRTFDILASFFGLIILSPLFAIVAILIKLDSTGPVLFTKLDDGSPACRVGQNGKLFKFYKFRTMRENTHHLRSKLASLSHRHGPLMKIKDDPRVTNFGKFLRRTSIDELPQLWNVLKGEMSLVGPRPHIPEEVADYEKHHKFLLTIKPGITGLSQISGRSDLDFEEEVRLDTFYIKHWTIFRDLKIILRTFLVVWSGKAAD